MPVKRTLAWKTRFRFFVMGSVLGLPLTGIVLAQCSFNSLGEFIVFFGFIDLGFGLLCGLWQPRYIDKLFETILRIINP